ncbi:HD-GYP domain-containing protein [Peribacillus sp. SCS-155]|uniref:HD-GYP domain-containing protein n=1 Tax=Peribacillus sedimenti TaxID=3115297 RepID=UPI003905E0CA
MTVFRSFQLNLLKNYLIGTAIAVFGVGSLSIVQTINLSGYESMLLLALMTVSAIIMVSLEYYVYKRDVNPIRQVYSIVNRIPTESELKAALDRVQRFPVLAVRRTLLHHYLGISIPAVSITLILLFTGQLSMPYTYLLLAICGAFLMSAMHALIEFFLTIQAIQPLMTDLFGRLNHPFPHQTLNNPGTMAGIKKKLLISSLFLAVFPIFLFSLMSMAKVREQKLEVLLDFAKWSGLFVIILVVLACAGAILVSGSIQQPIVELKEGMLRVKQGRLASLENKYTDEFSELIYGFNHMVAAIEKRDQQNKTMLDSIYALMAGTLDARDPYTAGHSMRVADYAAGIGDKMGLPPKELDLLKKSAILHDIGKIGIRDNVLLKEGKLTDEEFKQVKQHPVIGARILEQYNMTEELLLLVPGVKYHHERYDGKGYPEGLARDNIPLFGRIIAVADAYDAMTSDRTYRKGMDIQRAIDILNDGKGTQWDPYCTDLFIQYISEKMENGEAITYAG